MNGLGLCAGVGGLELGLELAIPGYRTVCYVEREAFVEATLVARMGEAALDPAPIWDDLTTFDGHPWRGVVDIVSAGFPCQPWSVAGAKRGIEDERWIWDDIVRVLREVQPRLVFLENVAGLVSGGGLGPVLRDLSALGFDAEWCVLAAQDVGATHQRKRVFILAHPQPVHGRAEFEPGESRRYGRRGSSGDGSELGNAAGDDERRMPNGQDGPRVAPGGSGGALANPGSERLQGLEPARTEARAVGRSSGTEVAHPEPIHARRLHTGRRETGGTDLWGPQEGTRGESASPGLPLFPPGPSDLDMWARVLAEAPTLEPSLCRMADGVADLLDGRTDRLRALGNGVVPLQAAYAFRALLARGGWECVSPSSLAPTAGHL